MCALVSLFASIFISKSINYSVPELRLFHSDISGQDICYSESENEKANASRTHNTTQWTQSIPAGMSSRELDVVEHFNNINTRSHPRRQSDRAYLQEWVLESGALWGIVENFNNISTRPHHRVLESGTLWSI